MVTRPTEPPKTLGVHVGALRGRLVGSHRPALGRGLDALIPTMAPTVLAVDVDLIEPNPLHPRSEMDPETLAELAASIKEHGLLHPLVVRPAGTHPLGGHASYEIIAGERRWRAAQLAGLAKVPVIVKEVTPLEGLQMRLVENLQRSALEPLEEAKAYLHLTQERGMTEEAVAQKVSKEPAEIADTLGLLRLNPQIQESLDKGEISEEHALALLKVPSPELRLKLWQSILKRGWSPRQTEEAIQRRLAPRKPRTPPQPPDPEMERLEEQLSAQLGASVAVTPRRRGGRIVIGFESKDELKLIHRRIARR